MIDTVKKANWWNMFKRKIDESKISWTKQHDPNRKSRCFISTLYKIAAQESPFNRRIDNFLALSNSHRAVNNRKKTRLITIRFLTGR